MLAFGTEFEHMTPDL